MKLAQQTDTFGNQNHAWLGSARGLDSTRTATLAVAAFTSGTHYPNGYFPDGLPLALATSGTYSGKYVPMAARTTEAQTVTITGTPTGGTATITLDGETTAAIAYNATASTVQTALEGLSNVSPGDVVVTGGPGPGTAWVVTFGPGVKWGGKDVPQMTATSSLTGGSTPAIAVTTTTAGGPTASDSTNELAGFLAYPVSVLSTSTVVHGALLDHGRVIVAKLPIALSAAQRGTNTQFVWV